MSTAGRQLRHPPGRGGRLWLQRRLLTARRGVGLLDLKVRILQLEQERFAALAQESAQAWEHSCAEAERWLLRAAVVGGQRGLRPDPAQQPASVDIHWAAVMGVRYPASATCLLPDDQAGTAVSATAALPLAAAAYRTALQAAVTHAAAQAAARVVANEVAVTRGRLRAIRDRWVPGLEAALRRLEASLEEVESAEGVRMRWARSVREAPAPGRTEVQR